MSGFAIKILAFIFMLGDHLQVLFPNEVPLFMRLLGRLAFPVFAFFTAVGMKKTKCREKYLLRLLFLAAVTEFPYDMCFGFEFSFFTEMNVVWTLLWGGILIYILTARANWLIKAVCGLCLLLGGCFLDLDYGVYGVVLIAAYYFFPQKPFIAASTAVIFTVKWARLVYPLGFGTLCWLFSCLGFVLPCLYNGKRGREPKYIFYFLYLGHILVLLGIKELLINRSIGF